MTGEAFHFKVGDLDCISLNDGYHAYYIETFFSNADRDDLEKALRSRDWPLDRVLGMHFPPFPCLGHVVDTGEGLRWQPVPAA